ncbi:cation-translocating P-type ATPase [Enhygromyxa salina]|uniref:Calcium-transporting ATPase 1 n=1 Tax=Enhygromyxa salina TaxID=215803 RepID=A0A2S9YVF3_9BACT|nr:cation-transporting P-type ATPase [Enhygromyxa salina]PRQ09078.1 Calcium-transporting ATPase 1 [Enhygromyxa salina]
MRLSTASPNWHAQTPGEALEILGVDPERGLTDAEADQRRREHGPNQLEQVGARPWPQILLAQLRSIVVVLLGAAMILAFATGRIPEGAAVLAVLVINTTIGFVTELRAARSMAALRKLGEHCTRARRDGREREIVATELVPGDIVLLAAGDLVPADLRLLAGEHLRVNEAALTGESVPVDKLPDPVEEHALLPERTDMLHKGTSVVDGDALGVVVATGGRTELGRIAALAGQAESGLAPMQRGLDQLGHRLAWVTLAVALFIAWHGFWVKQRDPTLVIETALALGIAAIPEGLPIVATIALARGMYRLAQRNALVNRLTAVETLGATRVIFTDKTGTLTENRMRLRSVVTPAGKYTIDLDPQGPSETWARLDTGTLRAMEVAVFCNGASLDQGADEDNPRGDPTEIALLAAGRRLGLERSTVLAQMPELRVEPFEPRLQKMATFHAIEGKVYVAVKGAPAAVLDVCAHIVTETGEGATPLTDGQRSEWREQAAALASEGLRVLALADKQVESADAPPYRDLRFVGLVGLLDPPRAGVKTAIDKCQAAGIRVAMVTGDQPETAKAIAAAVGIVGDPSDPAAVVMHGRDLKPPERLDAAGRDRIHEANIYARVSPEQKLNLVRIYQGQHEIVAMTGDGINDAPALKQADIGVAMGRRGTEAARQVADMVLRDDAFETIVVAVEQGRVIFANIRRAVIFMLCTNVAEVIAVTTATLAGWTLPLLPLQLLYLNVLTDVFPALALGVGPGSGEEMHEPPRDPREFVLTRRHWLEIVGFAAVMGACVLVSLQLAQGWLGLDRPGAVTISFLTLLLCQLWFPLSLRDPKSGFVRNEITRNPWIWGAVAVCVLLMFAAVYLPGLSDLLDTRPPSARGWALAVGMGMVPMLVGQVYLAGRRAHARKRSRA